MRKVLLITYHFPPDAAMGAVRPAQFAKYLPGFGWEPLVLTVAEGYYPIRDASPAPAGSVRPLIFRSRMFGTPRYYLLKLKHVVSGAKTAFPSRGPTATSHTQRLGARLRRSVGSLLSFPDEQAGWLPFALLKAARLVRRHNIESVQTSGPPHSVHLIGACLARLMGIPWVADFRDPYLDSVVKPLEDTLTTRLAKRLGAWLVSRSSAVITTTPRLTNRLRSKYPPHASKIFTVPNGYDPDEFAGIPREKEKRFTISHLGSLHVYHRRDPEPLLRTLAELIREKSIDPSDIALRFVGVHEEAAHLINSAVATHDLHDSVQVTSWLPRHQALEIMVRSHILLVLAARQPLQVPGKVYDYIAVGTHILALAEEGATADLLRTTATGIAIPPEDHRALKTYIEILYMEHLRTRLSGTDACLLSSAPVAAYSRKHLTQQLAHILDSLAQPITRLEPTRYASEEKMNRRYALIKTCTTRFR